MRTLYVLAAVALLAVSSVAAPAAAQDDGIDITVSVDGEEYDHDDRVDTDAEELVVNVTVESENELNVVESSLHSRSIIAGASGNSYNTSHVLDTRLGPNDYTVTVEDVEGNVERHRVNFYREATNPRELREVVERLQERRDRLEEEIDELEERRDELNQTQQDLRQQLNESDGSNGDDGGSDDDGASDEPQGLPGFGALVALVAAALVALGRRNAA